MVKSALSTAIAEQRRYRGDHGSHEHEHAQLLFGMDGALEVEIAGHLMRVDATTRLIVPAGERHASSSRHGANVLVIDAPMHHDFDRVRPVALLAASGLRLRGIYCFLVDSYARCFCVAM